MARLIGRDRRVALARMAALPAVAALLAGATPAPRLDHGRLLVDGRPYLILGGELANSSASSRAYMASRWGKLAAMHLNTVLMPVSWEQIEPEEGRFDFRLLDGLLADARAHGLHLVLLWFGSYKNSQSSYVPGWVKRDEARFPRARTADGTALEMLTPFAPANAAADARAFGVLMTHLANADRDRTVLMVQVENEVGMIPDVRDHSPQAEAAWKRPVPAGLPGAGQSWSAAFGADADEAFMAAAFARYVEQVAAAGRRASALPFYMNAALPRPAAAPGRGYPAAGPLPKFAPIWHAGAPSIDFLAPDIYFPNFIEWARAYRQAGEPLFVPEANHAGSPDFAGNALFALGEAHALGVSPFAIDEVDAVGAREISALYAMLAELAPVMAARPAADIAGARPPIGFDGGADLSDQQVRIAGETLTIRFIDPWTPRDAQHPETHGAILIALGPDDVVIAGRGVTVTFAPTAGSDHVGIDQAEEGRFESGRWVPGRLMNGDQTHQGRHVRLPPDGFSIQRVRLYHYR